jgi:hypothetical protein
VKQDIIIIIIIIIIITRTVIKWAEGGTVNLYKFRVITFISRITNYIKKTDAYKLCYDFVKLAN